MRYFYRAYLQDKGEEIGEVEARSETDAFRQLSSRGRSVFEITPQKAKGSALFGSESENPWRWRPLSSRRINFADFFADLATLTEAGLNVTQALRALHGSEPEGARKRAISNVLSNLSSGKTAREAFSSVPGLTADMLAIIGNGENTKQLPMIFLTLARIHSDRSRRKQHLIDAAAYPAFLLVLALAAIAVVTFVLVPAIAPIFESAGQEPPAIVSILISLRGLLAGQAFLVLLGGTILCSCIFVLPKARMRLAGWLPSLWLRMPVLGPVIRKTVLSRYLSTLSVQLANGTHIAQALEMAAESNSFPVLKQRLFAVRNRVAAGERLPEALAKTGLFDSRLISLVASGDEAGRVAAVTARAAAMLESEASRSLDRLISMMTPALTIALGLLIGSLVISVMTALLGVNGLALQ
ncbi:MAG: type II secretion system F family protein [Sphingopyxis sp.]|nr:type II secretion system F family protein [Sphingopyxis sp.]